MSPQHLPQASHPAGGGLVPLVGRLALDTALAAGAALRVTRFATTDVLGGWVLADPVKRWASRKDPRPPHQPDGAPAPSEAHSGALSEGHSGALSEYPFGYAAPPQAWRHRLASALDCPYCVGTQATLLISAALAATSPTSPSGRLLRTACAALAASYLVGHVSYRLDTAPTSTATSTATAPTQEDTK